VARFRQTENVDAVSSEQVARRVDFIPHQFFYRPDALPATQPTASKHLKHTFPGQLLNIESEILNTGIALHSRLLSARSRFPDQKPQKSLNR